jgi:hypothetical protein
MGTDSIETLEEVGILDKSAAGSGNGCDRFVRSKGFVVEQAEKSVAGGEKSMEKAAIALGGLDMKDLEIMVVVFDLPIFQLSMGFFDFGGFDRNGPKLSHCGF